MRVGWPTSGVTSMEGVVVGWRLKDTICVVGIVGDWLEDHGSILRGGDIPSQLEILGRSSGNQDTQTKEETLTFWLDHTFRPIACSEKAEIILFEPPDPGRLRFLTLDTGSPAKSDQDKAGYMAMQDEYSIGSRYPRESTSTLEDVLPMLNHVCFSQRQLASIGTKDKRSLAAKPLNIFSDPSFVFTACQLAFLPLITSARVYLQLVTSPLLIFGTTFGPLINYSATVGQIAQRLKQALDSPLHIAPIWNGEQVPLEERSRHYMQFWNTVWLIINDLILGYGARQIILQASTHLSWILPEVFSTHLVDSIIRALRWLNDWPVGLKLNTPLSQFLSTSLGLLVRTWGDLLHPLLNQHAETVLGILAFSSLGGLTLLFALTTDLLSLFTLHLWIGNKLTTLICKWQLNSLGGLWNLFRGKRWNVLRQRTDSYQYDVDQLFLGTLLFTVSAFLFPTVLTYAALFACIRVAVWTASKCLKVCITALDAFPLFELMLRIKEPSRLPAGVYFNPKARTASNSTIDSAYQISSYLELKNAPKSFRAILSPSSRDTRYTT